MYKQMMVMIFLLSGCASATKVDGPNGKPAFLVKCGNAVKSKCTAKAAELCPGGYLLLEHKTDPYNDSTKIGNAGALEIRADTTTTLLVQCK